MIYGITAPQLHHYLESNGKAVEAMVRSRFAVEDDLSRGHLDLQHRVANHFIPFRLIGMYSERGAWQLVFNAFHSNLLHASAALYLMRRGLTGSTWPIFRVIYEGLLFAKFCAVNKNQEMFDRWKSGDHHLSIRRDILKKIKQPVADELGVLWSSLCEPTHFSIYSGQPAVDSEHIASDLTREFSVMFILLALNENLLRCHLLSRSAVYYVGKFGNGATLKEDRELLKQVTSVLKQGMAEPGRQVIREFTAKWVLEQ